MWRGFGLLFASLALFLGGEAAHSRPAAADQGRIEVDAGRQQPLVLEGEWGFAWQRFVDPAWLQLPAASFAPVPSPWNDIAADGKPRGPDGWGSYVLQVDCPAGQRLAVEAIGQRTASSLYVNGELVAAHGQVGTSAGSTRAAVHNRVPVSREFACPLRLTLHVANYEHRAGGFVRPLLVGTADALARDREQRIIRHASLGAAYLLTALVALMFFAMRRRDLTPLFYGLFCVAMAVYADMIGGRLMLRPLPAQIPWAPYMLVEYLSWMAAMGLFLATLHRLFPVEIGARFLWSVLGALAVAAVAVVVLPPAVYSHVALPGQAVAVVIGAYVAAMLVKAQQRSPFEARVLLTGMAAIVAAQVLDLVLIDAPLPDRKFAPLGFAAFLLSPAVVIGRRFSQALNAEERNRTLEENARLREDVERMTRHDLKTPLNSILAATRLLRDGSQPGADQAELISIAQRAALRMLEMVNLSLGLYRMETGTYDFRPTAVDLQDVLTRVLVDLHGHAGDCGVTLHQRGSDRSPAYVQAEELLCYSILANVVKNAVEATAGGGTVTVDLRRGSPVELCVSNPAQVPPDVARHFFGKYVTGGKAGGSGLGTYSARLMARAQGGELAMRTGEQGTTLTLTLREAREEVVAPPPPRQVRPTATWSPDAAPRSVLVVDDDELNRVVCRRFLPSPPFMVETAANGVQAEASMRRHWPHFLVVDMEMPVRGGIDTVRWVREHEAGGALARRCGVVMLSGKDDAGSVAQALAAGADRFLAKPVSRENLLDALRQLEAAVPPPVLSAPHVPSSGNGPGDEVVSVDPELVEYFPKFQRTQMENLEGMASALDRGDRRQLEFVAHRAAGGLALMGLAWAAAQARQIERHAGGAPAAELQARVAALRDYLARVRVADSTPAA